METSKQLWTRRQELADKQHQLMQDDMVDEARIVEGQIRELDITLDHVISEEDKIRAEYKSAAASTAKSFAEKILGPRDEFKGVEIGFKNTAETPSVLTVGSPVEIELDIPGNSPSMFNNFANTLPSVPAKGDIHFKRRSKRYGEPDTWEGVDPETGKSATKKKVIYTWEDEIANQETVAGYVPISKQSLKDYDELQSVIETDLLIDLNEKVNAKFLVGNNSKGIVGAVNTPGIQVFKAAMGGMYYDAVRKMRTLCMKNGKRIPTSVSMHPDIKEAIDLYKTLTGLYQYLAGDIMWGMKVEEDFDNDGILVYDRFSAKKRPSHETTVEIGYINEQFIQNELCVLAETTTALQMTRPDAFVFASKADMDKTPSIESE